MKTVPSRQLLTHRSAIEALEARIAPAFGGILQLSALNGADGFKLEGAAAGDFAGSVVSAAGDINGDGLDDLIVGALQADTRNGAAYVIFGRPDGFASPIDFASLDGTTGFKLAGEAESAAGNVSAAGDVNGDGVDDLIIGARTAAAPAPLSGAVYVVFGHIGAFPATLNLGSLNNSTGFRIEGVPSFDFLGSAVAGAGDVNGDGFDDVIVGAPGASGAPPNSGDAGAAYVIFGHAAPFATLNVTTLNGSNGFKFAGVSEDAATGQSVGGAGDVNGDGFADLLIGAYGRDSYNGETYVVLGKAGIFNPVYDRTTLNGINGFIIQGEGSESYSGWSVGGGGDINGDGFSDMIIGALEADGNGLRSGATYVVFGKGTGFGVTLGLGALNGVNGFKLLGEVTDDRAGSAVANAGDVNGDGFDDVLIGAPYARPNGVESGRSYVIFGKAGGFPASLNLMTLDAPEGFKINGETAGDQSGYSLNSARDINGDGLGDFVIGARFADPNGSQSGAAYVVFGQASAVPAISIGDVTAAEGQAGTTAFSFTLTLSESSAGPVGVRVSTDNGSATAGSDFTAITNQLVSFAAGETSKTVTVNVSGDLAVEADEAFIVVLADPSNATIADGTGLGTILNDDFSTVSIFDLSVTEGQSGVTAMAFGVSLSAPSPQSVSVLVSTANGSATAPGDFTALTNQQVQFAPGETTKTVTVNVVGDTALEADETFTVTLSAPVNATIADGTAQGTILNDDGPAISISNAVALERHTGSSLQRFAVTLSSPATVPVTVLFSTASGTAIAGTDFTPVANQSVQFAPGETTKSVIVNVLGDTAVEPNETFVGILSSPTNATIADGTGTAIIINDDTATSLPPGSLSFTDADGDQIVIALSTGTIESDDLTFTPTASGFVLEKIDLAGSGAAGADLKITATPASGSDGKINIGLIAAAGINLASIKLAGDLTALESGSDTPGIPALGKLKTASLGAAQTSFPALNAGLTVQGAVGLIKVAGDIVNFDAAVTGASSKIADIQVGGSVFGGSFTVGRTLVSASVSGDIRNSVIAAGKALRSLAVGGSFLDSDLRALGKLQPATSDQGLALGTIVIQGDVFGSQILAGYNSAGVAVNGDAGIGTILIAGDFEASGIAAGVSAGVDTFFGTADDVLIAGGNSMIAKIAAINIRGQVLGSAASGDAFGLVAEEIGKLKIRGALQPLVAGPRNDLVPTLLDGTNDVRVREVA